jgi:hypothetical protein
MALCENVNGDVGIFLVGQTSGINLLSSCVSCNLLFAAYFCSSCS